MKSHKMLIAFSIVMLKLLGCFPPSAPAAILYKSYIVRQDQGKDILCDPYVVQKDDYITKLLNQRGDIIAKDFPKFLEIFSRLNPHVIDPNQIQPGQHIIIPLKILGKDDLPGQETGVVTIPFVTITNITSYIKPYTIEHRVQKGEFISRLITQTFGRYGSKTYKQGIELFKLLNPKVTNLNLIHPGQLLILPDPMIRIQAWYPTLFDASGRVFKDAPTSRMSQSDDESGVDDKPVKKPSPLARIAKILDGRLHEKGLYHFPRKSGASYRLDLTKNHMLELSDDLRILFMSDEINPSDLSLIRSFWKDIKIITIENHDNLEEIINHTLSMVMGNTKTEIGIEDNGTQLDIRARWIFEIPAPAAKDSAKKFRCINFIKHNREKTPKSIKRYLERNGIVIDEIDLSGEIETNTRKPSLIKQIPEYQPLSVGSDDPKTFVREMLKALDIRYAENVAITFPYVGIQVKAQSNLISTRDGKEVFVDFENLYGDAIQSIEKTGFKIIQIKRKDSIYEIIEKLLGALKNSYILDPIFYAAKRPSDYNTTLRIPGFLIEKDTSNKTLISETRLDSELITFLKEQDINVVVVRSEQKKNGGGVTDYKARTG